MTKNAISLDRALVVAHDLARDVALDPTLDHDRDHARAVLRDLAVALGNIMVRDSDHGLEFGLHAALDCAYALDHAAQFRHYRAQVQEIVAAVESALSLVVEVRGRSVMGGGARVPWGVAVRVTGWLVRALPVSDRALYGEIYRSELFELAQAARPRLAQLGYALHCLGAWWLCGGRCACPRRSVSGGGDSQSWTRHRPTRPTRLLTAGHQTLHSTVRRSR